MHITKKLTIMTIGFIITLISIYIIGFSIPSDDTIIESIDSNISNLNDKINENMKIVDDNRQYYIESLDTINTMMVLMNLPLTENISYSYESLNKSLISFETSILFPMMEMN